MINHLVESVINDLDDHEEYNSSTEEGTYINKITIQIYKWNVHDIILYACIGLVKYYEDVHEAVYTLDEPTLNDSSVLSNDSTIGQQTHIQS